MDVADWKTPADFFLWPQIQIYIERIDSQAYLVAIEFAQEQFLARAQPCPSCGRPAADLYWFSMSDHEEAWDAGTGRVGFLTLCECCQLQVDFLIDEELTEMQAHQWRECRTLS